MQERNCHFSHLQACAWTVKFWASTSVQNLLECSIDSSAGVRCQHHWHLSHLYTTPSVCMFARVWEVGGLKCTATTSNYMKKLWQDPPRVNISTYIHDVWEPIRWILTPLEIWTSLKLQKTFMNLLSPCARLDSTRVTGMCNLPKLLLRLTCNWTDRKDNPAPPLWTQTSPQWNCNSAVAQHAADTGHAIDWDEAKVRLIPTLMCDHPGLLHQARPSTVSKANYHKHINS